MRWSRWALRLGAAAAVVAVLLLAIPASRHALLRAVGWTLVVDDPLRPADAIVVAVDAGEAGVLEAADLVHRGFSQRVAIFDDPPEAAEREFMRRHIEYEDRAARETRELRTLGIDEVHRIVRDVVGTEDEGRVFPAWCDQLELRTVIVVSHADHTRRLRRVLSRALKGHHTTLIVRRARYSEFDPDEWWRSRSALRTGIIELEKLL